MTNISNKTNAARKAARTALQTIVAAAPMITALVAGLPAKYSAIVLGVTVPAVSYAQNALEDKGIIGTWIRRPTPSV